jgi:hypothetical protein
VSRRDLKGRGYILFESTAPGILLERQGKIINASITVASNSAEFRNRFLPNISRELYAGFINRETVTVVSKECILRKGFSRF